MSEPKSGYSSPDNARKYVCFCCGLPFDSLGSFKEHILANHEEGRDFVKCTLARCGFPVRDLRLHFKVHHPKETMPKEGQMRPLIWSDQKAPKKRKKPKFIEGYMTSKKNGGQKLHYRSSWERDIYMCLEHLDEISSYLVESFPVQYHWKGKKKRYFPDLLVNFADGHVEVWEIKPKNQKKLEINKAKWMACESHCEARQRVFKIIDEHEMRALKQKAKFDINMKLDHGEEINK